MQSIPVCQRHGPAVRIDEAKGKMHYIAAVSAVRKEPIHHCIYHKNVTSVSMRAMTWRLTVWVVQVDKRNSTQLRPRITQTRINSRAPYICVRGLGRRAEGTADLRANSGREECFRDGCVRGFRERLVPLR
jgi:hypothetical protein